MTFFLAAVPTATAGEWTLGAALDSTLTLTDNVRLAPEGQEEADLVLAVSPVLTAERSGARASLHATYVPTLYLYAKDNERSDFRHYLDGLLSLTAIEDFLFLDASANIRQTFVSPFGPLPFSGESITDNRTQTVTLGLSPYLRGETAGGYTYRARNDNFWTTNESSGLRDLFESRVLANFASPRERRVRWAGDYDYRYTEFESQDAFAQHLARLRLIYQVNPDLSVNGRLGYEVNDYAVEDYSDSIYGAGLDWRPTPRTFLSAYAERRFFGTGYSFSLTHRRRLAALTLRASRDTRTYREQLFLPAGDTRDVTDAAFTSRIADPIEREQAVDEFLARTGLPPVLVSPFTFYTNQIYVSNLASASIALFGARNSVSLSLFWQDNEPVTASGNVLPDAFANANRIRQRGGILAGSHFFSALTTLTLSVARTYSTSTVAAEDVDSTQDVLRLTLTRQLSPQTRAAAGARWVDFDSTVTNSYQERALFASIHHRF